MKTIEQENVQTTSSLSSLGKLRISDNDSFFDEYSFSPSFNMNRNANSGFGSNKGLDSLLSESNNSSSQWVIIDDVPPEAPKPSYNKPGSSRFCVYFIQFGTYLIVSMDISVK